MFGISVLSLVSFLCIAGSAVEAWNINDVHDRHGCQALSQDPLRGCDPQRTLYVSAAGNATGYKGGLIYQTVQSEPYTILIAPGTYTEQVNITRPGPTFLLGQTPFPTLQALNTVSILYSATALPGIDNAFTSVLTIAPSLNASLTGSGPTGFPLPASTPLGSTDFRTYNLNIHNTFAPYAIAPSLALSLSSANGSFYYTGFYSYQDTIYIGKRGNGFFKNSEIAGQTDFFYGFGTAWVANCSIALRSCGGGITAWKGSNTTYVNKFGVYIVDSNIHAANTSIAQTIAGKCALGRPWNSQMRAIIARTYLDASILPTGYIDWAGTPRYSNLTLQAEYQNYGPGWNLTAREGGKFETLLSERGWEVYDRPEKVFLFEDGRGGNTRWIDRSV